MADRLSGLEVDSLRAARRIADIGAGAGFPGLALAVALPQAQVDLVESAGRKTAVVDRLIQAGEVSNARSITTRAEELGGVPGAVGGGREAYDAVTARAVGPLAVLVEYAAPLLREGGVLVAWKGARDADEEAAGAEAARQLGMAVEAVLPVQAVRGLREPASARVPQDFAHAARVSTQAGDGAQAPAGLRAGPLPRSPRRGALSPGRCQRGAAETAGIEGGPPSVNRVYRGQSTERPRAPGTYRT